MTRTARIRYLIDFLLTEMPQYREWASRCPNDDAQRRRLLRGLMNIRPPMPLDEDFLRVQNALLSAEREERGVVEIDALPTTNEPRILLWQGDITRLAADAIVNAANGALLGCFVPCHGCIDNAIHSASGLQLRDECHRIMTTQDHEEAPGGAKLTSGYNLPTKYVLHTVGPIVRDHVTREHSEQLQSCYRACMELALKNNLKSVAFCCVSTGEFHFPNREAAQIAVSTVRDIVSRDNSGVKVIFNVFKDEDYRIYKALLG